MFRRTTQAAFRIFLTAAVAVSFSTWTRGDDRPGFHVIAKNSLDEEMYTTPAVSDGKLFVRTTSALVCISESGRFRIGIIPDSGRNFP